MSQSSVATVMARYIFFLGALPLVLLVGTEIPLEIRLGSVAAALLGLVLCSIAVLSLFKNPRFSFSASPLMWVSVPMCVILIVSAFHAGYSVSTWWGLGSEAGTVASIILFIATIIGGSLLERRLSWLRFFIGVSILLACVSVIGILFAPEGWGKSIAENWTHISFLAAAALAVVLVLADSERRIRSRVIFIGNSVVFAVVFALLFHISAALLLVFVLVLMSGLSYAMNVPGNRYPPTYAAAGVLFVLALLFLGVRGPILVVPSDVRPSLFATELVAAPLYFDTLPNALVGMGPHSLSLIWNRYRPEAFNLTNQWDITPDDAYSTAATFALEFGWLGFIGLLFCPVGLLVATVNIIRQSDRLVSENIRGASFAGACTLTLFSFGAVIIYPIGILFLLLAGLSLGMCASLLSEHMFTISVGYAVRISVIVVCVASGTGLLWMSGHQLFAASYHARAVSLNAVNSLAEAAQSSEWAATLWPTATYKSDTARAYLRYAFAAPAQGGAPDVTTASSAVKKAEEFADSASMAGNGYDVTLSRVSVYVSLAGAGTADAIGKAHKAIVEARSSGRTRPEYLLLSAILAGIEGKPTDARAFLQQALILKPDYEDAQKLLDQLDAQH